MMKQHNECKIFLWLILIILRYTIHDIRASGSLRKINVFSYLMDQKVKYIASNLELFLLQQIYRFSQHPNPKWFFSPKPMYQPILSSAGSVCSLKRN